MDVLIVVARLRAHGSQPLGGIKGCRGIFSVEFGLVLLIAMSLFALLGEFLRISMIDQTLARATHLATRAAATSPNNNGCQAAASRAITNDYASRWLLDSNDDGTISFHVATSATSTPLANAEVQLIMSWDQDPADGIDYSDTVANGCGDTGSWLRVQSRIAVLPWYGLFRTWTGTDGIVLRHESWGRNNRL